MKIKGNNFCKEVESIVYFIQKIIGVDEIIINSIYVLDEN